MTVVVTLEFAVLAGVVGREVITVLFIVVYTLELLVLDLGVVCGIEGVKVLLTVV